MTLLERDSFLTDLIRLLSEATTGQGRVVFLSGEAGVGKTSLVKEFCRRVVQKARVALGACDPLSTPRPLGPLLDVAETLGDLGINADGSRDHLFRALLTNLHTHEETTLLVFEDVHWADEATLDLLRFLGRRIGGTRALLVATYRDDEVGSKHPLRILLGDLATSSTVHRMALQPLSQKAVTELAEGSGLDALQLHQQTGGNPFFITEILATDGEAIPVTVRDAVLARVARLSASSRTLLETASVIGSRTESWLLIKVANVELSEVENLLDSGMLLEQNDGFMFRHELARQAILSTIPHHRQKGLHALVLEALKTSSQDLARLAHHAEAAKEAEAVLEYAPKAAQRAASLKAHREAAAQYVRALRFADRLEPKQKARLLESYAYECYLTEQLDEALTARQQALDIWQTLGEAEKQSENLRWLCRLHWNYGHKTEVERFAQAALEVLETQPPSVQLAMAYSNLSSLRMVSFEPEEAVLWGEKAVALARQFGDTATLSHALTNIGAARLDVGMMTEGRNLLEESLRLALEANLEERAARAWSILATEPMQEWQFDLAKRYLDDGIAYTSDHDLDNTRLYLQGYLANWLVFRGHWDEAVTLAEKLLRQPRLSLTSRIQPLVALGQVRARRGEEGVWTVLDDALRLAQSTGELQRLGPARAARAEAFWLGGKQERALAEARASYDLPLTQRRPRFLAEPAYWRWKLGDLPELPTGILLPFGLQMEDKPLEAAKAWRDLGCSYEAARALSEHDDETALKEALTIFENLGARPMVQRTTKRLRDLGIKGIPKGPRSETKANPAGLTKRELEVLHLLAQGQRDKVIARSLKLSERTVHHHVSAVLSKLGATNRAEATLEARRLGILPN
jgi:DNA-binding CsgD family transcriptional regulator